MASAAMFALLLRPRFSRATTKIKHKASTAHSSKAMPAPSELSKWPSPPPNTNHSRWLSSGRLKFAGIGDFYDQSEYRFSTDRPQFGMPDYEAFHVPVHNCCVIPTDMCTIPPIQLARPSASLPRKISLFNCAPASKMVSPSLSLPLSVCPPRRRRRGAASHHLISLF